MYKKQVELNDQSDEDRYNDSKIAKEENIISTFKAQFRRDFREMISWVISWRKNGNLPVAVTEEERTFQEVWVLAKTVV